MRPVSHLAKLKVTAVRRALRLRSLVDNLGPAATSAEDRLLAFVVIEATNLWDSFARSFFISCALHTKDSRGNRITTANAAIQSPSDAIEFAIRRSNSSQKKRGPWHRLDEPKWRKPSTLLLLSAALGSSNKLAIQAAFGYQARAFNDLPLFRNFYAHRNQATASRLSNLARDYALSPRLRPSDLLLTRLPAKPQNLVSVYITDIVNVIQLMT
jgi:hypothetical protein